MAKLTGLSKGAKIYIGAIALTLLLVCFLVVVLIARQQSIEQKKATPPTLQQQVEMVRATKRVSAQGTITALDATTHIATVEVSTDDVVTQTQVSLANQSMLVFTRNYEIGTPIKQLKTSDLKVGDSILVYTDKTQPGQIVDAQAVAIYVDDIPDSESKPDTGDLTNTKGLQ